MEEPPERWELLENQGDLPPDVTDSPEMMARTVKSEPEEPQEPQELTVSPEPPDTVVITDVTDVTVLMALEGMPGRTEHPERLVPVVFPDVMVSMDSQDRRDPQEMADVPVTTDVEELLENQVPMVSQESPENPERTDFPELEVWTEELECPDVREAMETLEDPDSHN